MRGYYGGPRKQVDHATRPSREMQSVLRPHRAFAEVVVPEQKLRPVSPGARCVLLDGDGKSVEMG